MMALHLCWHPHTEDGSLVLERHERCHSATVRPSQAGVSQTRNNQLAAST